MKRILVILMLAALLTVSLSACGCNHAVWNDANCTAAKTCAECGQTEGAPLGHVWKAATCETAKTCEVCGVTEGTAPGHNWQAADCENPKTCATCKLTEGEALGHDWAEATTDAPKTCRTCQKTEGEKINTDPRFTTETCKALFGTWVSEIPVTGEMMGLEGFDGVLNCQMIMTFHNDATVVMKLQVKDQEAFLKQMEQYVIDTMYAEFADQGYNKTQANDLMKQQYGMTVEEYAAASVKQADFNAIFDMINYKGVYYVDGNQLFSGLNWSNVEPETFGLEGDKLTLVNVQFMEGMDHIVFTKEAA